MSKGKIILGAVVVIIVLAAIGNQDKSGAVATTPTTQPAAAATPANQPDRGTIWFGPTVDSSTMTLPAHSDTFKASKPFGWIAIFSSPPNATTLTQTIASVDAGGAEANVATNSIPWSDPQADALAHNPENSLGAYGLGTYTIRYIVNGVVLAAGTVTITK